MPDGQSEGAETVILTVVDGDGYDPGTARDRDRDDTR